MSFLFELGKAIREVTDTVDEVKQSFTDAAVESADAITQVSNEAKSGIAGIAENLAEARDEVTRDVVDIKDSAIGKAKQTFGEITK